MFEKQLRTRCRHSCDTCACAVHCACVTVESLRVRACCVCCCFCLVSSCVRLFAAGSTLRRHVTRQFWHTPDHHSAENGYERNSLLNSKKNNRSSKNYCGYRSLHVCLSLSLHVCLSSLHVCLSSLHVCLSSLRVRHSKTVNLSFTPVNRLACSLPASLDIGRVVVVQTMTREDVRT